MISTGADTHEPTKARLSLCPLASNPTSLMWAISAAVRQGFVRVERAGEALVGHVGPLFVTIYVVLVGTGMWIFCMF